MSRDTVLACVGMFHVDVALIPTGNSLGML